MAKRPPIRGAIGLTFDAASSRTRVSPGLFSLALGTIYVLAMDDIVPEMDSLLPF